MNHFYFIRHGETVWNVENKICGETDIELTERGHEQAIETGKKILEQGITADVILTSPLVRAKETARHISEITGIPMEIEPRLKEQNFGRYESTPRDGAEFHEAKKDMASRFGTGESMLHLAQRIYNLLDDIKLINNYNKKELYENTVNYDYSLIIKKLDEFNRKKRTNYQKCIIQITICFC